MTPPARLLLTFVQCQFMKKDACTTVHQFLYACIQKLSARASFAPELRAAFEGGGSQVSWLLT